MLFLIAGAIGTALIAGAIIYLAVKLTVSVLKKFKKKKSSKIMAAQVKDLIKTAPTLSLDDLDEDDVVLAEYDTEQDDLAQELNIAKDVDDKVTNLIGQNGGIVVFD